MARPDDITEAAWAEAAALRSAVIWQSNAANETIARALMAAEARGRAEEREACANEALMYGGRCELRFAAEVRTSRAFRDEIGHRMAAAESIAFAIRKRSEA